MNALDWISALLGKGVVEPVATYFTRKAELSAAKHTAKLAFETAKGDRQAALIAQGLAADATWEIEQIKNSGWKDEYVLIVLSIPLVGCFVPPLAPHILRGFEILETTPDWFRWLTIMVFAAIYGIRVWRRQQYDTE